MTVPGDLGIIQDLYLSHSRPESSFVILIQDAHAIPEVQIKIQKLIGYFQTTYGVKRVALEGAASRLDPQIFKSFPDKKQLKKILNNYYENGELTGSTAAAILNDTDSTYDGIENWHLYEEGLKFYLRAMEKEGELSDKLRTAGRRLRVQKKRMYSEELLATDQALQSFRQNEKDLMETLKVLARIKAPEKGSELALLLEESIRAGQDQEAIKTEVNKLADKILMVSDAPPGSDATLFNQEYQSYRTSEMSAAEFALFLKERWTDSGILPVSFSPSLLRLIETQKTLRELEGTKLFRDFEQYAQSVKESLFRNNAERDLDRESRRLYLHCKLAKLELNREEWEEIKAYGVERIAYRKDFRENIKFYENAEKREVAFLKNLAGLMNAKQSAKRDPVNASLLVAGGFHTEGLTEQFKKTGVSHVVIQPRINQIHGHSRYREQMRGEVSWKHYFRVEDGKVNLYEAFVRGTRDRLLRETLNVKHKASHDDASRDKLHASRLLKAWRDQIIRDLAEKKQIAKAQNYIRFLDEVSSDSQSPLSGRQAQWVGLKSQWYMNIDRFIEGIYRLDSDSRLTRENIRSLLKPSNILGASAGNVVLAPERSEIRKDLLPGLSSQFGERNVAPESRSETRQAKEVMKKVSQWFRENPKFDKPGLDLTTLVFAAIADLKRNALGAMEGEPTSFHVDPLSSFETLRVISAIEAIIADSLGFDVAESFPEDVPSHLDKLEAELDQWASVTSIAGGGSDKFLTDAQTDWKNRIFGLAAKREALLEKKRKQRGNAASGPDFARSEVRSFQPNPKMTNDMIKRLMDSDAFDGYLSQDDRFYLSARLVDNRVLAIRVEKVGGHAKTQPDRMIEVDLMPLEDFEKNVAGFLNAAALPGNILYQGKKDRKETVLPKVADELAELVAQGKSENYISWVFKLEVSRALTERALRKALGEKIDYPDPARPSNQKREFKDGIIGYYGEQKVRVVLQGGDHNPSAVEIEVTGDVLDPIERDLERIAESILKPRFPQYQIKKVESKYQMVSATHVYKKAALRLELWPGLKPGYQSIVDLDDLTPPKKPQEIEDESGFDLADKNVAKGESVPEAAEPLSPESSAGTSHLDLGKKGVASTENLEGILAPPTQAPLPDSGYLDLSGRSLSGKEFAELIRLNLKEMSGKESKDPVEVPENDSDVIDLGGQAPQAEDKIPIRALRQAVNSLLHLTANEEKANQALEELYDKIRVEQPGYTDLILKSVPPQLIQKLNKEVIEKKDTLLRNVQDNVLKEQYNQAFDLMIVFIFSRSEIRSETDARFEAAIASLLNLETSIRDVREILRDFLQHDKLASPRLFDRIKKRLGLAKEPALREKVRSVLQREGVSLVDRDLLGRLDYALAVKQEEQRKQERRRRKPQSIFEALKEEEEIKTSEENPSSVGPDKPKRNLVYDLPDRFKPKITELENYFGQRLNNREFLNELKYGLVRLIDAIETRQENWTRRHKHESKSNWRDDPWRRTIASVPVPFSQLKWTEALEIARALHLYVEDRLQKHRSEVRSGPLPLPAHKILEGLREESPASLRAISDDINEALYRRAAYGEKEQSDIYRQVILRHQMTIEHAVELHNHGLSGDHLLTLLFGIWFAEISDLLESSHPLEAFSEYFTHLLQRRNPSGTFTDSEYLQDGKRGIFNAFNDFLATWVSTDERVSKETRLLISNRYIQFLKSKHPEEATFYSEMYKRVQVNPEFPRKFKKYLLLLQMENPYAGANPVKESFEKERLIDFRNALKKGKSNPAFYARALALGEATFSHFYSQLDSLISEYGYIHVLNQLQSLLEAGLSPKAYQEVAFKVILKETFIMVENDRDLRYLSNMAYRGKDQRIAIVAAMQILLKSPPKKRAKLNTKNRLEVLNALEKRYEDDQPLLDFIRALKEAEVRGQARSDVRLGSDRHQIVQNLALALGPEKVRSELRFAVSESKIADQTSRYVQRVGIQEMAEALYQSVEELSQRMRVELQNEGGVTEIMAIRHKNLQKILAIVKDIMTREFLSPENHKMMAIENGAPLAIALGENGQILGLPIAVPPGQLAKSLRVLGGTLLKKVVYVTDHTIPDELRVRLGVPTKRVPKGGRIEGSSLIGKARVANRHIFQMEAEVDATEMDPLTADLLIHLMAVTGVMVNYGGKGELIRRAADPVAELLKQYPGLNIILNQESLKFTQRNGSPVFLFATKALREKLSRKTLETAA
ncbi:MAG TPA: hypothetical protein VD913_00470 [bacterium]|nr:hypothetical protein [bacterium]